MSSIADVFIYSQIGTHDGELSARMLQEALAGLPDDIETINTHIYSSGGDAEEALAIADILKSHKAKIAVIIEGLAASAASLIAMAGETIRIFDNGLMLLHKPYVELVGNADDLRSVAAGLDAVQRAMLTTYRWHSWLSSDSINDLINKTTWMDAKEARDKGFVTEVVESVPVSASLEYALDPKLLEKLGPVPASYRNALDNMLLARRRNSLKARHSILELNNRVSLSVDQIFNKRKHPSESRRGNLR